MAAMKSIIDIEAFTAGLNKTLMSTGVVLPVVASNIALGMVPWGSVPMGYQIGESVKAILSYNIISSHV